MKSVPAPFLRLATLLAILLLPAASQAQERLPAPVAQALKKASVPDSAVAVVVRETDARAPRVSFNADKPMNPASVMKLVTTYAALELLGPAYAWKTEAYACLLYTSPSPRDRTRTRMPSYA